MTDSATPQNVGTGSSAPMDVAVAALRAQREAPQTQSEEVNQLIEAQKEALPPPNNVPEQGVQEIEDAQSDFDETQETDSDSEPQDEPDQPLTFKVKIDGEEIEVNQDELVKGYSREQDYTRKTMKLAEDRREIEAYYSTALNEAQQNLAAIMEYAQGLTGTENIDFDSLEQLDPEQWAVQKIRHYERQQKQDEYFAHIRQEQQRIAQQQQQINTHHYQQALHNEFSTLMKKMPDFSDSGKRTEFLNATNEYLGDLGFSPQEMSGIADHRMLLVIKDAIEYRNMQKKQKSSQAELMKRKTAPVPRFNKPGIGRTQSSDLSVLVKQQKQNPSAANAVAILQARRGQRQN